LLASLLLALPAASEPADPPQSWLDRAQLTSDWGGWRTRLADRGVELEAEYTAGFWSNLRGGFETGTRYEGFATLGLQLDLEKGLRWPGASFEINAYSYHGGQPSEDLVGPFPTQTVSGHETSETVRVFEIYLRQTFFDGRLELKGGQLAADEDFFLADNADALLNGGFGFFGLGRTAQLAPFYPLAAPGLYLRASSGDERWEAGVGVYTADVGEDDRDNHGFDHSFDDGIFVLAELRARREPFGRPGYYAVGFSGTTATLPDFETGLENDGGYGLYFVVDQSLLEQSGQQPGLGFFLRGYGAPQGDRAFTGWYVDFGLKLTRPFAGREHDVLTVGFATLRLSDGYVDLARSEGFNVSRRQSVLELSYRFAATGWLTLQPDLQVFFDPHFGRRDATVLGLRAAIRL
jgi:porin